MLGDDPYFARWLASIGIVPDLILRRDQVRALTEADYRELRDDFGATEEMIGVLQRLALDATDKRDVRLSFDGGHGSADRGGAISGTGESTNVDSRERRRPR